MTDRIEVGGLQVGRRLYSNGALQVDRRLYHFVNKRAMRHRRQTRGFLGRLRQARPRSRAEAYEAWSADTGPECGLRGHAQGHMGHAGPDGRHAGAEDRSSEGWREHRLGSVAHRRHAARHALSQGRRESAESAEVALEGEAGRHPVDPGCHPAQLVAGGHPARTRQQRAGHSRLCRALGRPGRRLLQGARHQQIRPDGGPRDAVHLAQHMANWLRRHRQRSAGDGDAEAHGRRRGSPERLRLNRRPMAPDFDQSIALLAAVDLVIKGRAQRSGIPSRFCMRAGWS